jgi:hypothetical protein
MQMNYVKSRIIDTVMKILMSQAGGTVSSANSSVG